MIIVADSSPLIAFAILKRLDLLEALFKDIIIPEAVFKEVTLQTKPFSNELKNFLDGRIKTVKDRLAVEILSDYIDLGESEAIILALENGIQDILLDDLKARKQAIRQGLFPIGTIGALIQAKKNGDNFSMQEYLDILIKSGYRISRALYQAAQEKAENN